MKWDYITNDSTMYSSTAQEFLTVGTTLCQAVFVPYQDISEDADVSTLLVVYKSYMKKVIPRFQYPAELIAALAQQVGV